MSSEEHKLEIEKLTEAEKSEYNDLVDAMNAKLAVTHPGSPPFGNEATDCRLKQLEQSIADIKTHLKALKNLISTHLTEHPLNKKK